MSVTAFVSLLRSITIRLSGAVRVSTHFALIASLGPGSGGKGGAGAQPSNGEWIMCSPEIAADLARTWPFQSWLLPVLVSVVFGASSVPFHWIEPVRLNDVTPTRFHRIRDGVIPVTSIASMFTLSDSDCAWTLTTSVDPAGASIWKRGASRSSWAGRLSTLTVLPAAPCSWSAQGCTVYVAPGVVPCWPRKSLRTARSVNSAAKSRSFGGGPWEATPPLTTTPVRLSR